ncbi:hypothetical protein [Streptomyces cahuitamycinicus]|uniref:Uncharacterized protein n=1 Tax=Streptomyces cahuitamycinicus TaxID=2070367 RepID=A0A2N8TV67_9ACTN|nr:hypothetical protein [Streptomyces cahuitamycinicus]PNG22915.1 hypothetical protein C1J00_06715 [Streptomyces cahuitamycinicus]
MEQRIGSSSQPLEGAGFDPAFIPGLTSPVSGRTEEDGPEKEPAVAEADEAAAESEETAEVFPSETEEDTSEPEEDTEAGTDGPVFEASDRRARMVADHRGVRMSLDDQECEFRWDEIGAVETETARFGKRYTVTVHTPDRRWYPIEIEAPARSHFTEWDAQLDAVLDAYFEDGEAEEDAG